MSGRFRNRTDAGLALGARLTAYAHRPDVLVLALPRGGVPVAFEIAKALQAPLDVFLVRKLGVPGREELAMGAIATGGVRVLNQDIIRGFHIPDHLIERVSREEELELNRRERAYRGDRPPLEVAGREAIVVDDGLATGSSMRAATIALRKFEPARIVVAVPVAAPETCSQFETEVDEIVCARTPDPLYAVGLWYEEFDQTTDGEVRDLLERATKEISTIPIH
jgi:putative phosphoribosyl transferase